MKKNKKKLVCIFKVPWGKDCNYYQMPDKMMWVEMVEAHCVLWEAQGSLFF